MKIIDAHLHFSNLAVFIQEAEASGIDYSLRGLKKEFEASDVVLGIGMGLTETEKNRFPDDDAPNPMTLDLETELPDELVQCVGINPVRLKNNQTEILDIEKELEKERVVGIKIYAGYYPFYVYDEIYEPVYELAARYHLPVVIHSGLTYSEKGFLKYAHPLTIDELAVTHKNVNFVISHIGDPWIMDTAGIAYKNPNVFADLSGLIEGNEAEIERFSREPLFCNNLKRAFIYTDNYEKYLFGTDWPLTGIKVYTEFIRQLIPEEYYEAVFYHNAIKVFPKLRRILENQG